MRTESITCDRCVKAVPGDEACATVEFVGLTSSTRVPTTPRRYDLCADCLIHVENEIRFGLDRAAHRARAGVR